MSAKVSLRRTVWRAVSVSVPELSGSGAMMRSSRDEKAIQAARCSGSLLWSWHSESRRRLSSLYMACAPFGMKRRVLCFICRRSRGCS